MPGGFFPAVEPDFPVHPLLERLRPAVQAEIERYDGEDVTVHAELRAVRGTDGDVALKRFYWSAAGRADDGRFCGYSLLMTKHDEDRPIQLPDAADEEEISSADAARRLDLDPVEQRNYTDQALADRRFPEDT